MSKIDRFILVVLLLTIPSVVFPQEKVSADTIYSVEGNDSSLFVHLDAIDVHPKRGKKLNYRRYSRLVRKIRKVYPFSQEAVAELEKYNVLYENATDEGERKKYVRRAEKELFRKHEKELKRFTISEGRYLILLIDRETGNTSYSIIKELKGGVSAVFWQGIAKIFNGDLKAEYDPLYEHYVIERIVVMVEKEYQEKQKQEGCLLPADR